MTGTEETLTESGIPIRSQLARFRVSGTGRGRGIVLLYPDKLAAVNSSAQLWGIFFGPIYYSRCFTFGCSSASVT